MSYRINAVFHNEYVEFWYFNNYVEYSYEHCLLSRRDRDIAWGWNYEVTQFQLLREIASLIYGNVISISKKDRNDTAYVVVISD